MGNGFHELELTEVSLMVKNEHLNGNLINNLDDTLDGVA